MGSQALRPQRLGEPQRYPRAHQATLASVPYFQPSRHPRSPTSQPDQPAQVLGLRAGGTKVLLPRDWSCCSHPAWVLAHHSVFPWSLIRCYRPATHLSGPERPGLPTALRFFVISVLYLRRALGPGAQGQPRGAQPVPEQNQPGARNRPGARSQPRSRAGGRGAGAAGGEARLVGAPAARTSVGEDAAALAAARPRMQTMDRAAAAFYEEDGKDLDFYDFEPLPTLPEDEVSPHLTVGPPPPPPRGSQRDPQVPGPRGPGPGRRGPRSCSHRPLPAGQQLWAVGADVGALQGGAGGLGAESPVRPVPELVVWGLGAVTDDRLGAFSQEPQVLSPQLGSPGRRLCLVGLLATNPAKHL